MRDTLRASIQGFVKIIDTDTREVLVDTHNDVLSGNMSVALAHALVGSPQSFLYYMGFGNGGAYVSPTGTIQYKQSIAAGPAGLIKNPTANLYNTIFVKKVSNEASPFPYTPPSVAYIPAEDYSTNYEDILIDVTIGYSEPPAGLSTSTNITQLPLDNSSFIGDPSITAPSTTFDPNQLVFNEIGLFAGSSNVFSGGFTATVADVDAFVAQGPDFSTTPGVKSKLMLTHVIFHPIQKSANRSINVIYTLRIQMG